MEYSKYSYYNDGNGQNWLTFNARNRDEYTVTLNSGYNINQVQCLVVAGGGGGSSYYPKEQDPPWYVRAGGGGGGGGVDTKSFSWPGGQLWSMFVGIGSPPNEPQYGNPKAFSDL